MMNLTAPLLAGLAASQTAPVFVGWYDIGAPVRNAVVDRIEAGGGGVLRRKAVELLSCPYCMAFWHASAFTVAAGVYHPVAALAAWGVASLVIAEQWEDHAVWRRLVERVR